MKKTTLAAAVFSAAMLVSCATDRNGAGADWSTYDTGKVTFRDNAPGTRGSEIYRGIISSPEEYIASASREVLATLYFSPSDSIVPVHTVDYTLEDIDGVSAKSGGDGRIGIFYSTRHIEKVFAEDDTAAFLAETRGVLLHELTHAWQLEPQGIGDYSSSRVFWSFIEGMADAVRIASGGFGDSRPVPGGGYDDGYRTTGYFLVWLRDRKDPDFLRKFNRTALTVVPWSYDGAFESIFGEGVTAQALWDEYQEELRQQQQYKEVQS